MPTRSGKLATARRVAELERQYAEAVRRKDVRAALRALQLQAVALDLYPPGVVPDIVPATAGDRPGRPQRPR